MKTRRYRTLSLRAFEPYRVTPQAVRSANMQQVVNVKKSTQVMAFVGLLVLFAVFFAVLIARLWSNV